QLRWVLKKTNPPPPTGSPAFPGARGMNPAPADVAMNTASRSVVVFGLPIGGADFFRRLLPGGNAVFADCPAAEIDQLATFAAERPKGIVFERCFFLTP